MALSAALLVGTVWSSYSADDALWQHNVLKRAWRERSQSAGSSNNAFGRKQGIQETLRDASRGARRKNVTILNWFDDGYYGHPGIYDCKLGTCTITSNRSKLHEPDTHAIWFYGPHVADWVAASKMDLLPLPRARQHQWILENDESPCFYGRMMTVRSFRQLFNHSVTFDAGSTWPLWPRQHGLRSHKSLDDFFTQRPAVPLAEKNRLRRTSNPKEHRAPVVFVQSNCNAENGRDLFVKELMKHVEVDSYGRCLNNRPWPEKGKGNWMDQNRDSWFFDFLSGYKFALSIENCFCHQYVTEKFFRPLHLGVVAVYGGDAGGDGGSVAQWSPGLPGRRGIIDVHNYRDAEALAAHILALDHNDSAYEEQLSFKRTGVVNPALLQRWREHGPIEGGRRGGVCRVCDRVLRHAVEDPTGKLSTNGQRKGDIDSISDELMKCLPPAKPWLPGTQREERLSATKANDLHRIIWAQRRS